MKYIIITSFILAAFSAGAQTTETREIKPFKNIDISGTGSVEYTESDSLSLKVSGDPSEIQNIIASSDGETLIIKSKSGMAHPYKIYVSSKGLSNVTCGVISKFSSTNTITSDSLSIEALSASSVNILTSSRVVNVTSGGASSVSLEGNTKSLYAHTGGSSSLKAYKLNATSVTVVTTGAASAKVFVIDKISANATGASSVKFKGDPKDVGVEASTSSTIAKVAGDDTQKKADGRDSTTFNFRKKKFIIIDGNGAKTSGHSSDDEFHHWAGFSMGVNGWLSNGSFNLPKSANYMSLNYGKSLNFQVNAFEHTFHIHKNYVNLVTGLGFEWSQYEFSNRTTLNADSSYTSGTVDSTGNFRKDRFKTTFVNVPLLLEFNTSSNPNKAFHVAVGVIGGYKLGSRTRQVYSMDGNDIKSVRKDEYNLNPIRVNAHLSLGYAKWTFFADYALTPLFENSKGPNLNPITIGLRIIPF